MSTKVEGRKRRWLVWAAGGLAAAIAAGAAIAHFPPRFVGPFSVSYDGPTSEWPAYGGDSRGLRHSALTQINRENVGALEIAWTHRSGDFATGGDGRNRTMFQATPIVVGETLYYCTPFNRVFALDAETGAEQWAFDPQIERIREVRGFPSVCRGVTHWADARARDGEVCSARIFTGTADSELIALDAETGAPCADFGDGGRVDLRAGMTPAPLWHNYPTSPPVVVGDIVVIGGLVIDNVSLDVPSGVVRGYDVRSGQLLWAWDPLPPDFDRAAAARRWREGEYFPGTPNAWGILSADAELGLVYAPLGNPASDYFAAARDGLDHFGSSVVALHARTGVLAWSFQTVHHDVWDYDVGSQPSLVDLTIDGARVPALVQPTKSGQIFVLDRRTGVPLFPVEERAVAQSDVPGEVSAPTQPFATRPAALHPIGLSADDAWGVTVWDRQACAEKMRALRSAGPYTPPSLQGTILYPGVGGGMNWGGVSIDPNSGRAIVNMLRIPFVVTLIARDGLAAERASVDPQDFMVQLGDNEGAPYASRHEPLLSPLGMPCSPPPWNVIAAVDLVTGAVAWERPLGTTRDSAPWPLWFNAGIGQLGGSLTTAGGLAFIGASIDRFIRAFDVESGQEVWRGRLPFAASATPMTYRLAPESRQFVVIAAGGPANGAPGDALVAFALPQRGGGR